MAADYTAMFNGPAKRDGWYVGEYPSSTTTLIFMVRVVSFRRRPVPPVS
jgi:hypothetical protein